MKGCAALHYGSTYIVYCIFSLSNQSTKGCAALHYGSTYIYIVYSPYLTYVLYTMDLYIFNIYCIFFIVLCCIIGFTNDRQLDVIKIQTNNNIFFFSTTEWPSSDGARVAPCGQRFTVLAVQGHRGKSTRAHTSIRSVPALPIFRRENHTEDEPLVQHEPLQQLRTQRNFQQLVPAGEETNTLLLQHEQRQFQ